MKPTPEQVKNRTSDYVCVPCGRPFLKKNREGGVSTFNKGNCGICGKDTLITNFRNYNYLQE